VRCLTEVREMKQGSDPKSQNDPRILLIEFDSFLKIAVISEGIVKKQESMLLNFFYVHLQ